MYKIFMNQMQVGSARVERAGLYLRFFCECKLPDDDVYKIMVYNGNATVKLGICVPDNGKFVLHTRIPAKYIPGKSLSFIVEKNNIIKVLLDGNSNVNYLDKLETARLQFADGQAFLVIS